MKRISCVRIYYVLRVQLDDEFFSSLTTLKFMRGGTVLGWTETKDFEIFGDLKSRKSFHFGSNKTFHFDFHFLNVCEFLK